MPLKPPRPGTKRETALRLLLRSRGATLAQVSKATGFDLKNTRDCVRLIAVHNGYRVTQKEDNFFAAEPAKRKR
jgi:hypothetical protein